MTQALEDAGVHLVLCVGYMRILSDNFAQRWTGRCLNVHPSLLPDFAGGMDLQVVPIVGQARFRCCVFLCLLGDKVSAYRVGDTANRSTYIRLQKQRHGVCVMLSTSRLRVPSCFRMSDHQKQEVNKFLCVYRTTLWKMVPRYTRL